jgi:hypothetical protein
MRKFILLLSSSWILLSCRQSTLKERLTVAIGNQITRLDPNAHLDSVRIIWSVQVNERLARVIDDTVYVREYNRIIIQLASAVAKNDRDSIAFYHYELNVLERGIDSVSQSISQGDTTHQLGTLLAFAYFLTKKNMTMMDSTMIYIDSAHIIRFTSLLDSTISRTIRSKRF